MAIKNYIMLSVLWVATVGFGALDPLIELTPIGATLPVLRHATIATISAALVACGCLPDFILSDASRSEPDDGLLLHAMAALAVYLLAVLAVQLLRLLLARCCSARKAKLDLSPGAAVWVDEVGTGSAAKENSEGTHAGLNLPLEEATVLELDEDTAEVCFGSSMKARWVDVEQLTVRDGVRWQHWPEGRPRDAEGGGTTTSNPVAPSGPDAQRDIRSFGLFVDLTESTTLKVGDNIIFDDGVAQSATVTEDEEDGDVEIDIGGRTRYVKAALCARQSQVRSYAQGGGGAAPGLNDSFGLRFRSPTKQDMQAQIERDRAMAQRLAAQTAAEERAERERAALDRSRRSNERQARLIAEAEQREAAEAQARIDRERTAGEAQVRMVRDRIIEGQVVKLSALYRALGSHNVAPPGQPPVSGLERAADIQHLRDTAIKRFEGLQQLWQKLEDKYGEGETGTREVWRALSKGKAPDSSATTFGGAAAPSFNAAPGGY